MTEFQVNNWWNTEEIIAQGPTETQENFFWQMQIRSQSLRTLQYIFYALHFNWSLFYYYTFQIIYLTTFKIHLLVLLVVGAAIIS